MAFQSPTYCDSSSIGSMNEWACNDDDWMLYVAPSALLYFFQLLHLHKLLAPPVIPSKNPVNWKILWSRKICERWKKSFKVDRKQKRDRESKKKKVFIINWCAEKKNFKSQRVIKSVVDKDWRCSWYKGSYLLNNKIGSSCRTKAQTDEKRNRRIFWSWKIEKEMWIRFHLWRASNILHNINKE